ncbi:MAG: hypothetical protein ACTHU0_01410 [Kofleriaceae bacterium]
MTRRVPERRHVVSIVVDGEELRGIESYDVSTSLTNVPATFSLRLPFTRRAWDSCRPDRPVRVLIDGIPVLAGFIDERSAPDDTLDVSGRCKLSRVVSESAVAVSFAGLGIQEMAARVVSPWFASVSLSNARNRAIVRGRGKKARAASEPIKINTRVGTAIEPGQTRWAVLERLLEQAGYLAWSSGDGRELVIGKPNYQQEIQFHFFRPSLVSTRKDESTVLSLTPTDSTADRYSRVIVIGSGVGTDVNYGAVVASRYGQALNDPSDPDGVGTDFSAPKRLVMQRSVQSIAEATEMAEAEMARRDAQGHTLEVRCAGHGQVVAGAFVTLFACDLLASVEDERTGTAGQYLITSCRYTSGRGSGEETTMTLVPKGAEISR